MPKIHDILNFKASIENDMFTHSRLLTFLDKYKIESIEYDANGVRIYKVSNDGHTCLLEVVNKSASAFGNLNTWETENYKYRILTKDE